jgi:hypothetical protein
VGNFNPSEHERAISTKGMRVVADTESSGHGRMIDSQNA